MENRIILIKIDDSIEDNATTFVFETSVETLETLEIYDKNGILLKNCLKYPNTKKVKFSFYYSLYDEKIAKEPFISCSFYDDCDAYIGCFEDCYLSKTAMNEFKAVAVRRISYVCYEVANL